MSVHTKVAAPHIDQISRIVELKMQKEYLAFSYPRLGLVTQLPRILSKREGCHWQEMIGQWIKERLGVGERRISQYPLRFLINRLLRVFLPALYTCAHGFGLILFRPFICPTLQSSKN